jgi:pimeloyl-ACP methyl ester carboxylesterase
MATLTGPEVLTVETPHGTVRVRDTGGDGTPILLVHSLLLDGDLYCRLAPLLTARGYRCIVPDLPLGAHGIAMNADADLTPPGLARLLVEILDALSVPQVHAVGVDTGGALTQILMAEHRTRVSTVVLTACDAYEAFPPRTFGPLLAPLRLPGALWLSAQASRFRLMRRLATLRPLTHAGVDDVTVQRWTTPLRDRGIRHDLHKVLTGMDARHTLAAASANLDFPRPVLIAWGDDDRAFPRRLGERLAHDLPISELVTLPDCGAFAALDQPQLLADLIDRHVGSSSNDFVTVDPVSSRST